MNNFDKTQCMKMKATLICLILLMTIGHIFAKGYMDWSEYTSNQTYFDDGRSITLANGDKYNVDASLRWYFYKNHIIGEGKIMSKDKSMMAEYFVIDEINSELIGFEDKATYETYLKENKLTPLIWTRWHKTDWNVFWGIILSAIVLFPISLGLISWNLYILWKAVKLDKFSLKSKWTRRSLVLPILLLIFRIMSEFPQSI